MTAKNKTVQWVRLGDYIEECDERNVEGRPFPFYGINKEKMFMPTVADTNQLDNSRYKVVGQGVFVFSGMQTGRDQCIRLALRVDNSPVLISPAYTTFRIKDEDKLLHEYLFIFFKRKEMDRYGAFLSDGSIRSNLDWDRFCDIRIPLPSLEVQRELVDTYTGLQRLAEDNEDLIAPLTEACQAFIVDCQKKYPMVKLGDYIKECDERNTEGKYTLDDVRGMTITKEVIPTKANLKDNDLSKFKVVYPQEFIYNPRTHGKKIGLGFNKTNKAFIISWNNIAFRVLGRNILLPEYLFILFCRDEWDRNACFRSWGSSTEVFDWKALGETVISLPPLEVQESIVNLYHCIEEARKIAREARAQLQNLCPALIQYAEHN